MTGISLTQMVNTPHRWPTPTTQDNVQVRGIGKTKGKSGTTLGGAVRMFSTPKTRDYKDGNFPNEFRRNTLPLAAQAGGSLNPTWVEWLMGWPLGWTDLKPLAMDKFHLWRKQHLGF
jgi:hypothetical protein